MSQEKVSSPVMDRDHSGPRQFPCGQCGASLHFLPGATSLICGHCGHTQEIAVNQGGIEELDFDAWMDKAQTDGHMQDCVVTQCTACGAKVEPERETVAFMCPFCGTAMDLQKISQRQIKPTSLLPFNVAKKQAQDHFRKWVTSRWFAPSQLKKAARHETPLNGLYIPYWTFDAQTHSDYNGQRGIHYHVQENYMATEGGKSVQKTRTVTHTRWSTTSGHVAHWFNDVLVIASHLLQKEMADKLEPWDLENLVAYDPDYVSGFRVQSYQLGLTQGFEGAKERMAGTITRLVREDIGGDEQRIDHLSTHYSAITFKHILLPIWLSTYRFGDKRYQFLINGRTGEVQGERPYSWVKITLTAFTAIAVLGGLWWFLGEQNPSVVQ
ncbi:MAG: hypothetical protein HQL07_12795 [Nitrospirae bacterium]|nr:hypothetical protein [Magnetococcales bacterium]